MGVPGDYAATHPIQAFIALYIHQIEFAALAVAMVYHVYRFRREMFGLFKR